jgi:hypothetical protein
MCGSPSPKGSAGKQNMKSRPAYSSPRGAAGGGALCVRDDPVGYIQFVDKPQTNAYYIIYQDAGKNNRFL